MVDLLITGAEGQLGHELARRATARGRAIEAVGRGGLDITDAAAVAAKIAASRPKLVINAAAYTAVDKAESDAETAWAVNRDGPAHLAATCADLGIPLVHVSTDYVFDGTKVGAYAEDDPVAPLGVYGASKEAGEAAIRRVLPHHVILRTAWVFGPHGANFVKTMLRVGKVRERLTVVDDQHGCPTHAGDLAEAILSIADEILAGTMPENGWGTFHCAGQGETTWCGFAREIFDQAAPRLERLPEVVAISTSGYPTPAARPANSVLDCDRLERIHGLRLRHWTVALADMLGDISIAEL